MRSTWLVARHEYRRMVRRRSFLLGTLAIPLLIAVVMAISVFVAIRNDDARPLGYVDQAGVFAAGPGGASGLPQLAADRGVEVRAFESEEAARAALAAGEIQAFYLLPPHYLRSGEVTLTYWDEAPADVVREQFDDLLRVHLAADLSPAAQRRAVEGPSITIRSADGSRQIDVADFMSFVLPIAVGIFFVIAVMSSASYMLQAVTTEKENRTMELMITSITPGQLIGGKAVGLMAVSLTQLGIWCLAVAIGLIVGARFLAPLRDAHVPWDALGLSVLYFLPAYALVGGMMTALGSAVAETRQAQQYAGILNLLFTAPFYFIALIMANPSAPLAVALSFFPTTAFMTISLRWTLSVVPLWQMVLSWALLAASAVASVWAAARILRVGMLRYGQRIDLRTALRALRGRAS
ncbi:MAG: ABC transporter permease [Anaerolineae bacterium]|nr:ABC transporter permease [Anaerolineae bacterium]